MRIGLALHYVARLVICIHSIRKLNVVLTLLKRFYIVIVSVKRYLPNCIHTQKHWDHKIIKKSVTYLKLIISTLDGVIHFIIHIFNNGNGFSKFFMDRGQLAIKWLLNLNILLL